MGTCAVRTVTEKESSLPPWIAEISLGAVGCQRKDTAARIILR